MGHNVQHKIVSFFLAILAAVCTGKVSINALHFYNILAVYTANVSANALHFYVSYIYIYALTHHVLVLEGFNLLVCLEFLQPSHQKVHVVSLGLRCELAAFCHGRHLGVAAGCSNFKGIIVKDLLLYMYILYVYVCIYIHAYHAHIHIADI